ncbi:cytochrome b/b6 domain-containing protein [Vibrio amylolyticus]|uniref:cytochrome b/b6 domain-containing protein n=1 Tax=Vibrio amylolyticus TaxID=2847292 RepID=UPI00354F0744
MKIWDIATRMYHWLQAIVFTALALSGFSGTGPHIPLGLILMTLTIWRIGLGFWGSETSRFSQFLSSPQEILSYLKGQNQRHAGHNPLGGLMVITLIGMISIQCLTGIALAGLLDGLPYSNQWMSDDAFTWIEATHLLMARVLPLAVALHVVAIVVYKLNKKPLLKAMLTGYQDVDKNILPVRFITKRRAFLMLVLSGFVTMAIIAPSMV